MRDVQGTSEVGMNEPARSSFTKELLPLLVWPTTNRVDFLAEYDDRRCFSASVIRSAFMLSLSCCLIRSIKPCVPCEHCSKKVISEVKSLNWSSNEDDVSRLETAMKQNSPYFTTLSVRYEMTGLEDWKDVWINLGGLHPNALKALWSKSKREWLAIQRADAGSAKGWDEVFRYKHYFLIGSQRRQVTFCEATTGFPEK